MVEYAYQEYLLSVPEMNGREGLVTKLEQAIATLRSEKFHVIVNGDDSEGLPSRILVGAPSQAHMHDIKRRAQDFFNPRDLPYRSGDWYSSTTL